MRVRQLPPPPLPAVGVGELISARSSLRTEMMQRAHVGINCTKALTTIPGTTTANSARSTPPPSLPTALWSTVRLWAHMGPARDKFPHSGPFKRGGRHKVWPSEVRLRRYWAPPMGPVQTVMDGLGPVSITGRKLMGPRPSSPSNYYADCASR